MKSTAKVTDANIDNIVKVMFPLLRPKIISTDIIVNSFLVVQIFDKTRLEQQCIT